MDGQLYLQVTAGASALRAGVNGVGLFSDDGGDGRGFTTRLPIDEWILPQGGNVATIDLRPLAGADLVQVAVQPEEVDKDALVELAWRATGSPLPRPFRVEMPFHPPDVRVKTRLWTEAAKLEGLFDEAARLAAIAAGLDFYGAFALKNADRVTELAQYKAVDVALAYDTGPDEVVEGYLRAFQRPAFALEPLVHDGIRTTLVGGGRAVLLTRGDDPWLQCVPAAYFSPLAFPVCVALVDGKWVVAR